jgi:membrane protease YdiL (CAAX protease family)
MKSQIVEERDVTVLSGPDQALGTSRLLAGWEIASITLSFLIMAWLVRPLAGGSRLIGAIPFTMALVLILISHRARGESLRDLGWRMDTFPAAARLLALPLIVATLAMVIVAAFNGHSRSEKVQQWSWLLWMPLWALVQQYVLQGFINRRAQLMFGPGWRSVLLVAVVFAVLHLPNPWLTVITFAGGALLAAVYQRAPNLPALALAHFLISLMMVWLLPSGLLKSLRIGFKYFG